MTQITTMAIGLWGFICVKELVKKLNMASIAFV